MIDCEKTVQAVVEVVGTAFRQMGGTGEVETVICGPVTKKLRKIKPCFFDGTSKELCYGCRECHEHMR